MVVIKSYDDLYSSKLRDDTNVYEIASCSLVVADTGCYFRPHIPLATRFQYCELNAKKTTETICNDMSTLHGLTI